MEALTVNIVPQVLISYLSCVPYVLSQSASLLLHIHGGIDLRDSLNTSPHTGRSGSSCITKVSLPDRYTLHTGKALRKSTSPLQLSYVRQQVYFYTRHFPPPAEGTNAGTRHKGIHNGCILVPLTTPASLVSTGKHTREAPIKQVLVSAIEVCGVCSGTARPQEYRSPN